MWTDTQVPRNQWPFSFCYLANKGNRFSQSFGTSSLGYTSSHPKFHTYASNRTDFHEFKKKQLLRSENMDPCWILTSTRRGRYSVSCADITEQDTKILGTKGWSTNVLDTNAGIQRRDRPRSSTRQVSLSLVAGYVTVKRLQKTGKNMNNHRHICDM